MSNWKTDDEIPEIVVPYTNVSKGRATGEYLEFDIDWEQCCKALSISNYRRVLTSPVHRLAEAALVVEGYLTDGVDYAANAVVDKEVDPHILMSCLESISGSLHEMVEAIAALSARTDEQINFWKSLEKDEQ